MHEHATCRTVPRQERSSDWERFGRIARVKRRYGEVSLYRQFAGTPVAAGPEPGMTLETVALGNTQSFSFKRADGYSFSTETSRAHEFTAILSVPHGIVPRIEKHFINGANKSIRRRQLKSSRRNVAVSLIAGNHRLMAAHILARKAFSQL